MKSSKKTIASISLSRERGIAERDAGKGKKQHRKHSGFVLHKAFDQLKKN
jgi:hypothetical protein